MRVLQVIITERKGQRLSCCHGDISSVKFAFITISVLLEFLNVILIMIIAVNVDLWILLSFKQASPDKMF